METVLILLTVFSFPVAAVTVLSHYRFKVRQLAAGMGDTDGKVLRARCEELEARVRTLETIVCSGDFEAAAKMRVLPVKAEDVEVPAEHNAALPAATALRKD